MKKQILKIIENRMKNISDSDVISHNCYTGLYNEIEALDEVKNNGVLAVVSGSLPSNEELQKVVERIAYEQHGQDQAEDCYAKMGILHEFVKTYVDSGNDR